MRFVITLVDKYNYKTMQRYQLDTCNWNMALQEATSKAERKDAIIGRIERVEVLNK